MNPIFEEAKALQDQAVALRRTLHQIPGAGFDVAETKALVRQKLEALGLTVEDCGKAGLTALIEGTGPRAKEGKTLLLRADMDAVAVPEENDLPFASKRDCGHLCGHDLHTTMLITAAELLLAHRSELNGQVKLMFQASEEDFKGSRDMIQAGLLENPHVDAAFGIHTGLEEGPGSYGYCLGYMATSADIFQVTVQGKGGHGAYPHTALDPIAPAALLHQGFNNLIAREVAPQETAVITLGAFHAGAVANVIPDQAKIQGTFRCYNPKVRAQVKERMQEMVDAAGAFYRTQNTFEILSEVKSLHSDPAFTQTLVDILAKEAPALKGIPETRIMASDDFAEVSQTVPSAYFMLNCKVDGNNYSYHNPRVQFDEAALYLGVGIHVTVALGWLNMN